LVSPVSPEGRPPGASRVGRSGGRRNEVVTSIGQSQSRRRGYRSVASFGVGAALLIAGGWSTPALWALTGPPGAGATSPPASTASSPALKPIDRTALQSTVDKTARELLVPGAVVFLRTPQGDFTVTYGTTRLGAAL